MKGSAFDQCELRIGRVAQKMRGVPEALLQCPIGGDLLTVGNSATDTVEASIVATGIDLDISIAAASGASTNVFAVNQEYSRATTPAGGDQIQYKIAANFAGPGSTALTDATAYPAAASTSR